MKKNYNLKIVVFIFLIFFFNFNLKIYKLKNLIIFLNIINELLKNY